MNQKQKLSAIELQHEFSCYLVNIKGYNYYSANEEADILNRLNEPSRDYNDGLEIYEYDISKKDEEFKQILLEEFPIDGPHEFILAEVLEYTLIDYTDFHIYRNRHMDARDIHEYIPYIEGKLNKGYARLDFRSYLAKKGYDKNASDEKIHLLELINDISRKVNYHLDTFQFDLSKLDSTETMEAFIEDKYCCDKTVREATIKALKEYLDFCQTSTKVYSQKKAQKPEAAKLRVNKVKAKPLPLKKEDHLGEKRERLGYMCVFLSNTDEKRKEEYYLNSQYYIKKDTVRTEEVNDCVGMSKNDVKKYLSELGITTDGSFHCPNLDNKKPFCDHFRIDAHEKSFHEDWLIALNNKRTRKITVLHIPAESLQLFDTHEKPIFRKCPQSDRYQMVFSEKSLVEINTGRKLKNYLVGVFDYK